MTGEPTSRTNALKVPVLLLKTKSSPTDAYEDLFSTPHDGSHFESTFVPVLQHCFAEDGLQSVRELLQGKRINNDVDSAYGGLIFTSQRAVEAFAKLVEEGQGNDESWPYLQDVPVYSVGPATTRALRAIPQSPPLRIFGEHTGTGDALAQYILEHYGEWYRGRSTKPSLLFLVGEQRRDIIPKTLTDHTLPAATRIEVTETVVYGTKVMESFPKDFESILSSTRDRPMRLRPRRKTGKATKAPGQRSTLIATIGPTTRDHLTKTFDFEPDVCAVKPSPEGIWEAITNFKSVPKRYGIVQIQRRSTELSYIVNHRTTLLQQFPGQEGEDTKSGLSASAIQPTYSGTTTAVTMNRHDTGNLIDLDDSPPAHPTPQHLSHPSRRLRAPRNHAPMPPLEQAPYQTCTNLGPHHHRRLYLTPPRHRRPATALGLQSGGCFAGSPASRTLGTASTGRSRHHGGRRRRGGLPSLDPVSLNGYRDDTEPEERLLARGIAEEIRTFLPERLKIMEDWRLVYSLYQNGSSLATLYQLCERYRGVRAGFVLVVRDGKDGIFGAYLTEAPHPAPSYYGTGECFLWRASLHAPLPPPPSADTTNLNYRMTTIASSTASTFGNVTQNGSSHHLTPYDTLNSTTTNKRVPSPRANDTKRAFPDIRIHGRQ
ncbi:hypothetical protein CIB48_g9116 [Xylaria polymorpha]|nr:hypothetical protein CIB48_g9116 [Xylaria polymorpha]